MENNLNYVSAPLGITIHHRYGLHVTFTENLPHHFHLKVISGSNGLTAFDGDIPQSDTQKQIFRTIQTYFVPWHIIISKDGGTVYEADLNIVGKKVCMDATNASLRDLIAWMPIFARFRYLKNANVYVAMPQEWVPLFQPVYGVLHIIPKPIFNQNDYFAVYPLGIADDKDLNHCPVPYEETNPMVYAAKLFGIQFSTDDFPVLAKPASDSPDDSGKYICVSCDAASITEENRSSLEADFERTLANFKQNGFKVYKLGDGTLNCLADAEDTSALPFHKKLALLYNCNTFIGQENDYWTWIGWAYDKTIFLPGAEKPVTLVELLQGK